MVYNSFFKNRNYSKQQGLVYFFSTFFISSDKALDNSSEVCANSPQIVDSAADIVLEIHEIAQYAPFFSNPPAQLGFVLNDGFGVPKAAKHQTKRWATHLSVRKKKRPTSKKKKLPPNAGFFKKRRKKFKKMRLFALRYRTARAFNGLAAATRVATTYTTYNPNTPLGQTKTNALVFVNPNKQLGPKVSINQHSITTALSLLNYYFSFILQRRCIVINFNYFNTNAYLFGHKLGLQTFRSNKFLKSVFFTEQLLGCLGASLRYRDSCLFSPLLKEMFEHVHYAKHKRLFYFTHLTAYSHIFKRLKPLFVLGARLNFHGKLGVGGNSKKRSIYINYGMNSNSTKLAKIDYHNTFFRTATGVVGFSYEIYY